MLLRASNSGVKRELAHRFWMALCSETGLESSGSRRERDLRCCGNSTVCDTQNNKDGHISVYRCASYLVSKILDIRTITHIDRSSGNICGSLYHAVRWRNQDPEHKHKVASLRRLRNSSSRP